MSATLGGMGSVAFSLRHRVIMVAGACLLVLASGFVATGMGSEFLPSLDEGDILVHGLRIPGTSLTQAVEMQNVLEKRIRDFPEVSYVFAKIGTAEIATDPMGIELTDIFLTLKPREEWKRGSTQQELAAEIEKVVKEFPGINAVITQPIEMRMNEMIAGIRSVHVNASKPNDVYDERAFAEPWKKLSTHAQSNAGGEQKYRKL